MAKVEFEIGFKWRDRLRFTAECHEGVLSGVCLQAIGGPEFLELVQRWRENLSGEVRSLKAPQGNSYGELMVRELILRLQDRWEFPYKEEELCHCRVVSTQTVDEAVLMGAETAEMVARWTSAGTGCGTCRPDTEKIISCRRA